jgi:cold shock CspA family protein
MKDRILSAYLKDFIDEFSLTGLAEGEAFERFASYCLVSKHYTEVFDPDDVVVGGPNDLGIDAIATLVNDHLVQSNEDVDHLKTTLRRLDVQFIFIQSKTTPRFEGAAIGTFVAGVRTYFSKASLQIANSFVRAQRALKEHIYDSSIDMDRSPICRLYYVALGSWQNDATVRARIDQGLLDLQKTDLFSTVEIIPVDAETLKRIHRELHHRITREIVFDKHTILPPIAGVQEAYIGLVPCTKYLSLISDDDGTLNRRLFYDNVRDFQGHNAVNLEIQTTIREAAKNDRFCLLNNGVTIVARDANKVGATFKLKDFQVVNGCQTSHMLHLNRAHLTDAVFIPLKLIVTTDAEVTNAIIQGTNRQTEVKLEAFESLAPFQKTLEEFYAAAGRDRPDAIYYERRSKQYDHLGLRRDRIMSLATQIKCFVAMFLNEPHSTHRYYGELLASYRSRLFLDNHSPWPYYISGVAFSVLDRHFANGTLPRSWKPYKAQILMVFRLLNQKSEVPFLNSKEIESYCQVLLDILDDPDSRQRALAQAGNLVEGEYAKADRRDPPERTKAFTAALLELASAGKSAKAAATARIRGTVKSFSDIRGYGFIVTEDGREVFVHHTFIIASGWRTLTAGQEVTLSVVNTDRGVQAREVRSVN